MSSSTLKILACVIMLIDHIGAVLFPDILILRVIGRLAFPLFAFFIAEGYKKTSDVTRYMGRLFIFALITQIVFNAAFVGSYFRPYYMYLNVLFTLGAGLVAIYSYDKYNNIVMVIFAAAACEIVNTDYGAFGVLLVFIFYKFYNDFHKMTKAAIILMLIFVFYWSCESAVMNNVNLLYGFLNSGGPIEPLSLFSLILIKYYNGKRGYKLKYLFYVFYPAHLFILDLINRYIMH